MKNSPSPSAQRRSFASPSRIGFLATTALAAVGFAAPASAQLTRAGVVITNTASASYDDAAGTSNTINSNTVSLRVDELLDVAVASADSADIATTPGASGQLLTFRVSNTGNGEETFRLTANGAIAGDSFDPSVTTIYLDSDGNGVFDPSVDQTYVAGTNDPLIAAESAITVFVLSKTPSGVADGGRGGVSLAAAASTGTGAAGTTYAGKGTGGGDAVVGSSTGDRSATGYFRVSAATVDFVKSAVVADQYGGSSALPGATITYTLVARTTGSGSVLNLRVGDGIPEGTSYVPGTLTLDGTGLTDASDSDAGAFATNRVAVGLGTVPGGAQHSVTFKVKIN